MNFCSDHARNGASFRTGREIPCFDDAQKREVTGRIVAAMQDAQAVSEGVTFDELLAGGRFTAEELETCGPAAAIITGKRLERDVNLSQDENAQLSVEGRQPATVERGIALVLECFPKIDFVHLHLRTNGFTAADVGEKIADILKGAGQQYASLLLESAVQ